MKSACLDLLILLIAVLFMVCVSPADAQNLQTIWSFNGTNGANPEAALTLGNDGNFYGTTEAGGSVEYGTVFQVTTNGTLTTLISFSGTGTNGANPVAALTLGNDGNFYGTTEYGNSSIFDGGTIFKITTNGTLTTLVNFKGDNGLYPEAALTLGNDGNFYGTTVESGIGPGTIFKLATNGTLTTLIWDIGLGTSLMQGNDGNFYGTTDQGSSTSEQSGSTNGYGTIFQVTTNGTLTTLVSFNGTNGATPEASLTLGNDGNFYGTTESGGSSGYGTIFQLTTNGTLTTLVSFNGTNGANPDAALTLGNDGNFYGTTRDGGIDDYGTIFQVSTNGMLTTLVSFNSTNGSYPLSSLTLNNDGNFYGTTESGGSSDYGTVFRLMLTPGFSIQPQSQTNNAGVTVIFLCATILQPVSLQWHKNGANLTNGGNISGATNSTLVISDISDSDAASYSVVANNAKGSVSSSVATLTVIDPPSITTQPTNLLVLVGTNVTFDLTLAGAPPFSYQWQFNNTNLLNATNAIYTIPTVRTNNAGNYSLIVSNPAGSVTSSNAALTVVLSPTSQTNYASSTATFKVTAISPEPLNYQWQKNGANLTNDGNISGATSSTLTIANASDMDAANYSAVVSDTQYTVTSSNATLTVIDSLFIATQPLSQTVAVGSNVTFVVIAYGAPPFIFQWYFNNSLAGSPTSGTNVSSFTLPNVQSNQSGKYTVQIINDLGSLTSSIATLTVVPPPVITAQPSSRTNITATAATFSVVASSVSPLSYQWQKNGSNLANGGKISGASNSTLTITNVSDNEAATYSVIVANLAGSVTSSNAVLTVIPPPPLRLQIEAGYPVLSLYGTGNSFLVQYSSNLSGTNWINLFSITNLPFSPYPFLDPSGVGEPARFYRALFTP